MLRSLRDCADASSGQPTGFPKTIEPLYGIDVSGLDLSLADIEDEHDREVLCQNGAQVS